MSLEDEFINELSVQYAFNTSNRVDPDQSNSIDDEPDQSSGVDDERENKGIPLFLYFLVIGTFLTINLTMISIFIIRSVIYYKYTKNAVYKQTIGICTFLYIFFVLFEVYIVWFYSYLTIGVCFWVYHLVVIIFMYFYHLYDIKQELNPKSKLTKKIKIFRILSILSCVVMVVIYALVVHLFCNTYDASKERNLRIDEIFTLDPSKPTKRNIDMSRRIKGKDKKFKPFEGRQRSLLE